jgi:beta-glucosidase
MGCDLIYSIGRAMGNEAREYGVDILLAPGINIMRNPLTGRNFEYYSEDPVLTGKLASSIVNGIQSEGVGTSVKHFAVNNQETYRNGINAVLSQRALREIYLKAFSIVVREADPWTIMSSYNKINGTYAAENKDLLTKILREEWKFKGYVMTDWWAEHDAVKQLQAGNDLLMPGHPDQFKSIIEGVKLGTIKESELDENAKRILTVNSKTQIAKNYKYSDAPDLLAHAKVAGNAAADGMVLLKNNATLPALKTLKVALFGNSSYDLIVGGTGSGNVNRKYKMSLNQAVIDLNIAIDSHIESAYMSYLNAEQKKMPAESFWRSNKIGEFLPEKSVIEIWQSITIWQFFA